jgi:hypothetical protein
MSMSEFERQPNKKEEDSISFLVHRRVIPADFSEEDIVFAQELEALFALDEEDIPPYFVQTLLEPDDPGFQAVEPGFERKTRARVFRRLHLHRRLFSSRRPPLGLAASGVPVRRSLVAVIAVCMLLMLFTVAFTSQSFVEGVAVLLHGARAGVYQVHTYPNGVTSVSYGQNHAQAQHVNLAVAQQRLHFPIYWPQMTPNSYLLENIYLYQEPEQTWADGPLLELEYDNASPAATIHGTGQIAIREFKSNENILQVVEAGAADAIQIDTKGRAQAIYVDGHWISSNRFSHHWVYGGRSELIYQKDGVVFWIVGDQRDGIGKDALLKIAQSLEVVNIGHFGHIEVEMTDAVQLVDGSSGLFTGDIIAAFPDDGEGSPDLIHVGPGQAPQEKPIQKHGMHPS